MMEHIEYVFRMTNIHHVLHANYGGCADVEISLKCTLEHEESQKEKGHSTSGKWYFIIQESVMFIYLCYLCGRK